jgi:hypothetical protein
MRLRAQHLKLYPAARIAAAVMLMLALLGGVAPLGGLSSSHLCTMSCCAGLPPHEAGSCMHGACHVNFTLRTLPPPAHEELCGGHNAHTVRRGVNRAAPTLIKLGYSLPAQPAEQLSAPAQVPPPAHVQAASVAAIIFTKPCLPDCGAGTFSSQGQSRPRDSAALSYAGRARPPTGLRPSRATYSLLNTLDALCRRSRPRGPPLSHA